MIKTERKLHQLDAAGQTVGRLATQIALILRGKNKPEYQPHLDLGDIVEVINIKQLKFTGKKLEQKKYFHVTGYIGGLKTKKMNEVFAKDPGEVLSRAVREMLPPTRLRPNMLKRLIIK
ncbi:MAG: 50S ribosomal protein L13 [Patescibacteria group bacterium]|jgi:large subunit ribosomal protein L13|nr:50S ribosomal protein L13 [Patescibacteria group bacterium]MDD3939742.1 50S ribosomal protein L13 [Patescibacteria group bacterium]MDD4443856.1 50S ribosomal protein L13 [Patescibacteria group bacterium]